MDFEGYDWVMDNRFEAPCFGAGMASHPKEEVPLKKTKDQKHRAGECPWPGCTGKFVSRIRGFGYEK